MCQPTLSRRALGTLLLATTLPLAATAQSTAPVATTLVRMHTPQGAIDVELYGTHAPGTVANFMRYVREGRYDGTAFHRSVRNFVIQAGQISWPAGATAVGFVNTFPTIANEYSDARPNVRGTIAMAKIGGQPNSASSQWFFNLVDNTTTLGPANNGGFTVFGKVTPPSLALIDAIGALRIFDAGGGFNEMPVQANYDSGRLLRDNLALVTRVEELPPKDSLGAHDRIFNYLEAAFPQYAPPGGGAAGVALGYDFRFYAATGTYVGTKDGQVHYLVPALSPDIHALGALADWLAIAKNAGY